MASVDKFCHGMSQMMPTMPDLPTLPNQPRRRRRSFTQPHEVELQSRNLLKVALGSQLLYDP